MTKVQRSSATHSTTESLTGFIAEESARLIKAIIVGSLGNLIEWYDVYAFSAFSLYFSRSFFTGIDPIIQQRDAAIVFALGFVMRPVGSALFGWIADKNGRKLSLFLSVLLMCLGSLLIAFCPSANSIGTAAPLILLFARILQGMSQGGEYGASTSYLSEMSHPQHRGFFSGIWYSTLIGGQLVAIMVLLLLQELFLSEEDLYAWGWRIPFILGAALSVFALFMRTEMHETEHFQKVRDSAQLESKFRILLRHWKAVLIVFGFTMGGTSAFYTYTTYMQKFLTLSVKLEPSTVTLITFGSLLFAVVLQPLYGAISDRIGRKPLLIFFGITGFIFTYPILASMRSTQNPWTAFGLVLFAWLIVSGYTSIAAVVKTEMFPTSIRAIGVGIPYALAVAIFGGTMESIALTFKNYGRENWFFIYATILIFISLGIYVGLRDTKKHSLLDK